MVVALISVLPPCSTTVSSPIARVTRRKNTFIGSQDARASCAASASSHRATFPPSRPTRTLPNFAAPLLRGVFGGSAPVESASRRSSGRALAGRMAVTAAAAAAGEKRVLVTFDVDGTLMHSTGENANRLHKKAFSFALKEVFGIDGTIDVVQHHGSTDQMILVNVLEYYDIPTKAATAKLPELQSKMVEFVKANSTQVGEGLELLPGVASLLEILSKRNDVVVALVTGNLEKIGWLKMDGLGIRPFFSTPNFGGFGSDHMDRGELVKIAAARAKTLFPGEYAQRVHVGDTPNDIQAADYGGALAIGVCTGTFSRDDLLKASKSGSAVILDDLADSAVFLKACGLQ